MKTEKHKWIVQDDGTKICSKCQSKIQNKQGRARYIERDGYGVMYAVNWYPRCNPPKQKEQSFEEWSDEILDFNKSIGVGQKNAIHL